MMIIIIILTMISPQVRYKKYDESLKKMHKDLSNCFDNCMAHSNPIGYPDEVSLRARLINS